MNSFRVPTSLFPERIEDLFVNSLMLKQIGTSFKQSENQTWHLNYKSRDCAVKFYPDSFEKNASLQLMSFGNPVFEEMLSAIDSPQPTAKSQRPTVNSQQSTGTTGFDASDRVWYF
ncbi:MAG: hypothetical protein MUE44_12280 [Oscillatoriaceae cyanobacterium Prado104]|jgi:hypothetical protein|nr:hypothetical protein [Oscillatoriaceae cyanobacterium Prado104]